MGILPGRAAAALLLAAALAPPARAEERLHRFAAADRPALQAGAAPPPGIACIEGEAIPRDRQGRLAASRR
ncbi:hypothetical protein [Roseomonas sp. USHLN139]|uniref:hypothetical protein n=1 Tax=Roseomonas sp. USHLN139 TaxID=3081298 RepID=UPI003B01D3BD